MKEERVLPDPCAVRVAGAVEHCVSSMERKTKLKCWLSRLLGIGVDKEGKQFSQWHLEPKAELRPERKSWLPHPWLPNRRLETPALLVVPLPLILR